MQAANLARVTPLLPFCEASFPLAAEQRGLWFLHRLEPRCGCYHMVFSFSATLTDERTAHIAMVLADLIAEYPILRTSLPSTPTGPQQWVWNTTVADVRVSDARDLDSAQLRERMRTEAREPFDLAHPPLWRIHCYQVDENQWAVALVVHHILLDFWSLGLLLQDVAARLGFTNTTPLVIDGAGYGAYASKQAQEIAEQRMSAAPLNYWRSQLVGAPPVHGLPLDYRRPARQTYRGASLSFCLSREVSDGVKRLAQTHSATPFMVLLATYYVLLNRFSGDTDLVVATPVAGRAERSQRNMLGQFVNTLALRCQVDPAQPFAHLLASVRQIVVDALRHQNCPFSALVEDLAPQRDASYAPVAQLGFSWERLPLLADFADFFVAEPGDVTRNSAGITLKPFPVCQQEGQLDLLLEMGGEREGALIGVLKYHDQLFRRETAEELVAAFSALVGSVVGSPAAHVSVLNLRNPMRSDLALEWGVGAVCDLPESSVLDLIYMRAAQTPDATAVCDRDSQLTYRMMLDRSRRVAVYLQQLGVGPDDRVGLMLDRNCDLLVAMLGIWSAGAAYVPLDPSLPLDRLAYMAADAGIAALVSVSALSHLWPAGVPLICMDLPLAPADALFEPARGESAYLLYTSGSTGNPKGVLVGQRSVLNFLMSMQKQLAVGPHTRLLAVTTPAFDISVLELLLPVLAGGTVVVSDRDTTLDGAKLAQRIEQDEINMLQATPASWKLLLDSGWQGRSGLVALCGGEALSSVLAAFLLDRVGQLWNVYGPTETTVWSTAAHLRAGEPIHLGRAIANTQLYVLDDNQQPLPPGFLGELWIGGAGLAIDYWQRPDLTDKQFRELATLPHAGRLYRTGDRVRWGSNGKLEHHGRLDFQVKLRGFRIELGEIETALRAQPGISDAVVTIREDRENDQRLVAYVVGEPPAPNVLASTLRAILPTYMVPSAFVLLDALPQTPNRKVNRKALPAPVITIQGSNFVAPRDATEIQLATLFSELLAIPTVGIHDNFFALGGHSLLAVQLVARIGRLFGVELPVSDLIQHGSVEELATRLQSDSGAIPSMMLKLKGGHNVQPLWLFHPIGGNVFCYLELTRQLSSSRAVLAFQSPGLEADDGTDVSVEAMAQRYLAELKKHQPHGPYLLGGWCFGGVIAFEVARQLRAAGEFVDGIAAIDTRAPIQANVPSDADDATLLSWFARDLASPFGKTLHFEPEALRVLPADEMFAHVLTAAKAIEVLPANADEAQLQRYFAVYIASGIALQTYFPPADSIPVLLLRARDEVEDFGPSLGWSELVPATLHQVELAGNHSSIMYAPQASAVAAAIDSRYVLKSMPGFSI